MHFKLGLSGLAALAQVITLGACHYVLQFPISVGYTDSTEATAPCGGYSATSRTTVTDWPLGGLAIAVITTHSSVTWEYKVALLSSPTVFVSLTPVLTQTGVGHFCEPVMPGYSPWLNQDAILQVIQHAPDGALYQCEAIKFVSGAAATPPASCYNSSVISAHW
ncbi:hypothetical protein B0T26DRAFT_857906 [Lasiosphaeria miniovina]|uniref:Copper acquisition factor BIM1-like domain-containing protein n=1 Tax=Lasiosphaeria miniovina TaxID=1954250 RepID=A0AA40DU08_9PEZI|nr:uncharacterized protein B0T26DRAFT_857906 [Lasiosphaeria miniovina]KAK0713316.1 hypothetical protein B0T26DRAFT_857906 [Lasiosphaeria miniovina]